MNELSIGSGIALAGIAIAGVVGLGIVLQGTKPQERSEILLASAALVAKIRGS